MDEAPAPFDKSISNACWTSTPESVAASATRACWGEKPISTIWPMMCGGGDVVRFPGLLDVAVEDGVEEEGGRGERRRGGEGRYVS